MYRSSAAAHDNPDDDEIEKDKSNGQILTVFLNRLIQELGHARGMENRVVHISLWDFNNIFPVKQFGNPSKEG
jgi:hypothetical protein